MKVRALTLLTFMFMCMCMGGRVLADRSLDRMEILGIFEQLTNEPRETWVAAGTIKATHLEYKAPRLTDSTEITSRIAEKIREYQEDPDKPEQTVDLQKMRLDALPFNVRYRLTNEYTMNSTEIIRFDGGKFYWEITVDSRTDSVTPGKDLSGNFMTNQFDLSFNARRIFAWDGENYVTYVPLANHATVSTPGVFPYAVHGALTAGVIPWGHGYYEYENLSNIESSAVETYADGQAQIHLTLRDTGGVEMVFVLDPAKAYATISYSIRGRGNSIRSGQCSDYQLVSGNWVPAAILIERRDVESNRLLTRDVWNLTTDATVPEPGSFAVAYVPDTLTEYFSDITNGSLIYRYSEMVDTEWLLLKRLAIATSEDGYSHNCATITLQHAFSQLGEEVPDEQFAQLVTGPNNTTSLFDMKQFAQDHGLYCRAVRTDIPTLKGLNGCEAILHFPGKDHFVVLGDISDEYVWSIDLTSNKFYYRTDLNFFDMDWTEGTALLISSQPLQVQGGITDINDVQLGNIVGAEGYSCTRLLQTFHIYACTMISVDCWGTYEIYPPRYGCEAASTGSCTSSVYEKNREAFCIEPPDDPLGCMVLMPWTLYYMLACGACPS